MSEIRNCHFRFQCPQQWGRLLPTENASVRHCPQCAKSVHLCRTPAELMAAIKKDWCVAVDITSKSTGKVRRLIGDAIA